MPLQRIAPIVLVVLAACGNRTAQTGVDNSELATWCRSRYQAPETYVLNKMRSDKDAATAITFLEQGRKQTTAPADIRADDALIHEAKASGQLARFSEPGVLEAAARVDQWVQTNCAAYTQGLTQQR